MPELPAAPFRFEMGLRRGDLGFFTHTGDDAAVLIERAHWLKADPARYAAALDDAGPTKALLADAVALATSAIPTLQVRPDVVALGRAWALDFLLLAPDSTGAHTLRAGCVCFPSHWDLREKLGRPLAEIHAPVPTLNLSLARQIDTFLTALRPGAVWERWNWGLAATPERNNHPALRLPRITPETSLDHLWLRAEHQAFVRLPATGGVLFAIRIVIEPLPTFIEKPGAAARLADLLATMPDEIARYKGVGSARESLVLRLRAPAG